MVYISVYSYKKKLKRGICKVGSVRPTPPSIPTYQTAEVKPNRTREQIDWVLDGQTDGGQRADSDNRSAMRSPSPLNSQQPHHFPSQPQSTFSWPVVPLTCQGGRAGGRVGTSQGQACSLLSLRHSDEVLGAEKARGWLCKRISMRCEWMPRLFHFNLCVRQLLEWLISMYHTLDARLPCLTRSGLPARTLLKLVTAFPSVNTMSYLPFAVNVT